MATFEDSEKVRINKQYQDIIKNISASAPYDLKRAVEVAAQDLRDFRLVLYRQKQQIKQKYDSEQENLNKQTSDKHAQLIRALSKAKRAVVPFQK